MGFFGKFTPLSMLMICWFLIASSTNDDRIVIIASMIKMDFVWFLHITLQNYNSMLDKMLLTLSPVATSSALSYLTNRVLLISVHQVVMSSVCPSICMFACQVLGVSCWVCVRPADGLSVWPLSLRLVSQTDAGPWSTPPSVQTTVFAVVVVFGVIISDWFC